MYPLCPLDKTELDLHLHGGASCPTCGTEFEINRDRVLPSDRSVDEFAHAWPDTLPWGDAEQYFYRTAADEWMPNTPQQDEQPYPFLYHPPSGSLTWGVQNGVHDDIYTALHLQGNRAQPGTLEGRWYPKLQNRDVVVYDRHWRDSLPPEELNRHYNLIRANAPTRVAT